MTDSAKKPDTQSIPKYELPSATGKELDTIGETVGVSRWNNIRIIPIQEPAKNHFIDLEKAKELMGKWHKNFPRLDLKIEPLPRAWGGFDPYAPREKYVIIFRKKRSI